MKKDPKSIPNTVTSTLNNLGSSHTGTFTTTGLSSTTIPLGSTILTYPDPTSEPTSYATVSKKELLLIKVTIPERFTEQEIAEQIQTLAVMEDQLSSEGFTVKHYIITSSDCNTSDIEVLYPKFKDDEPTKKEKIKSAIKVITKGYK